jgi:hypothetical protein
MECWLYFTCWRGSLLLSDTRYKVPIPTKVPALSREATEFYSVIKKRLGALKRWRGSLLLSDMSIFGIEAEHWLPSIERASHYINLAFSVFIQRTQWSSFLDFNLQRSQVDVMTSTLDRRNGVLVILHLLKGFLIIVRHVYFWHWSRTLATVYRYGNHWSTVLFLHL